MINILETGNKNNYTGKMKDKSVVIMLCPRGNLNISTSKKRERRKCHS